MSKMRDGISRTIVGHVLLFALVAGAASVRCGAAPRDVCDRPRAGAIVGEPGDRRSENGTLRVSLTIHASRDARGNLRYCYVDERGNHAPTLRVRPGDMLYVELRNDISPQAAVSHAGLGAMAGMGIHRPAHDPCAGGPMTAATTNLHFHGLAIPPVCHEDDTLRTLIEPGDPPFQYRVRIPRSQPPGLYWYHPHVHGFSEEQLLGGASGALIVEGIESVVPEVKGLPERVLVIRDEQMPAPARGDKPDPNRPTKQLSINYVPVPYPKYPPAVIEMRPGARELWRVVNASADTYVDLYLEIGGKRRNVGLVSLDGVPVAYGEGVAGSDVSPISAVFLPPAARAEFIVDGPPNGEEGRLLTSSVNRGADDDGLTTPKAVIQPGTRTGQDDNDTARPLAAIVVSTRFVEPEAVRPAPGGVERPAVLLSGVRPVRKRTLYFSERLSDPKNPSSPTLFFITEEGHTPAVFDPNSTKPNITVRQGTVEDWTIENRSRESHVFHIHELHFIVVGGRGVPWEEPTLRDTVNLPAWNGFGRYPSLTLRMDFRDPTIIGTFPFHCHIAQHLDGGMMGTVRVEPVQSR